MWADVILHIYLNDEETEVRRGLSNLFKEMQLINSRTGKESVFRVPR